MTMRRDRFKKTEADENKKSIGNSTLTVPVTENVPVRVSVKDYDYMKLSNGKVIKLNWTNTKKTKTSSKLFTIKCVNNLIEVKIE